MSLKNLLVTFVTSEEASVTQRSAMSLGATLSIVLAVAILTIGLTAQSPHAWSVQECCGSVGGYMYDQYVWWDSALCNPQCYEQQLYHRECCSATMCGCTQWQGTGNYRVCCTGQGCYCYNTCAGCGL